ncbi:hypothetical protein [Pyrococcus kukulkanii]|uniref:Uncharacterized protein n=1 Tax=Pyrococcus kukulkanii TaxID=1609559 RepID=A0ABV4T8B4_9EURY
MKDPFGRDVLLSIRAYDFEHSRVIRPSSYLEYKLRVQPYGNILSDFILAGMVAVRRARSDVEREQYGEILRENLNEKAEVLEEQPEPEVAKSFCWVTFKERKYIEPECVVGALTKARGMPEICGACRYFIPALAVEGVLEYLRKPSEKKFKEIIITLSEYFPGVPQVVEV